MIHKNILKLIGCCLETQTPILVFEYAEYGTLDDRIYHPLESHFEPLLLKHKLKIAMEMANAFAYLHVGFPRPIVFIKYDPFNVVFHDQYAAKLFDFSSAASIPEGETHILATKVEGTYNYMAPEYLRDGILNEKCDVYSFGVFLLELLAGEKVGNLPYFESNYPSSPTIDFAYHLQNCVRKNIQDGFSKIIDLVIKGEGPYSGKDLQLQALPELIFKCVSGSAQERPTMIDVAKQLRQMYHLS